MKIVKIKAREILDTRGDKTVEVCLSARDFGKFYASAPNGKSRGKFEAKSYKKSLKDDIKFISNSKIKEIKFECFDDLVKVEKIFNKEIGANTMIALEYAFLKALAKKKGKNVWEIINPRAKNMPMPVGNAIGGGRHSSENIGKLKPNFQEFHFIPEARNFAQAVEINKRARENCAEILKSIDKSFKKQTNDENAWQTCLNDEQAMNLMLDVKENIIDEFNCKVHCGIDAAASEFYESKNDKYAYSNKNMTRKEQIDYLSEIADKFFYLEDPLQEDDFSGFSLLRKKVKGLIVGDDLTVTNLVRIKKAFKIKAINGVIIKPNQCGSLIEVRKIVEFCKKNKIKTIFSHRSGETKENILADLAFGFVADYIKTGICGKGRDEKLNRLIEIEKSLVRI